LNDLNVFYSLNTMLSQLEHLKRQDYLMDVISEGITCKNVEVIFVELLVIWR